MVDTDVNCIHFPHIEKSFSHLCHDSSLRSSSCHQLYDTKQRSLMGSCMVQSSTANLHESTTPASVRDMRWHSQLLVACRSGKVLVEQWPPLRRQSAEAPSNQNNVTAVELNSQSVSTLKCNSLFRGDWEEDQMHGKGVWGSDGLNMKLSGANCHAFVRGFFHAELWCFTSGSETRSQELLFTALSICFATETYVWPTGAKFVGTYQNNQKHGRVLSAVSPPQEFWVTVGPAEVMEPCIGPMAGLLPERALDSNGWNCFRMEPMTWFCTWFKLPNSEVKSLPLPIVSRSFDVFCRYAQGKQILWCAKGLLLCCTMDKKSEEWSPNHDFVVAISPCFLFVIWMKESLLTHW